MRRTGYARHARTRRAAAPPRLALLALLLLAVAAPALSASLEDYQARVARAARALEDVLAAGLDEDEGQSAAEFAAWEARQLATARRSLPPKERIEWAGGAVEIDNTWLHKELDERDALPADDSGGRARALSLISERLRELSQRLQEAANTATAARNKEAEKGRLQMILRRPEYNEAAARGGALQRLWEWLAALLRRLMPRGPTLAPSSAGLLSLLARLFVYALAAALLVLLVWRYAPLLWVRFRTRRKKARQSEARVVLGERIEADRSAADLIEEAEQLARAGDLRGAIRKAYVAVLCELGDRKLIRLARHKTNRDYLNGLRERPPLYELMRPLTRAFERHWYGLAPASDADWDAYRDLCRQAQEKAVIGGG